MTIIKFGRKVFEDNHTWYHTDYMCRREVVKIGKRREVMKFLELKGDPMGSPRLAERR